VSSFCERSIAGTSLLESTLKKTGAGKFIETSIFSYAQPAGQRIFDHERKAMTTSQVVSAEGLQDDSSFLPGCNLPRMPGLFRYDLI
jgi:hypothetical protein